MTIDHEGGSETPIRVLVADDDPDILALVTRRLERRGYEVLQAHNGNEALARAIAEAPDVVVLDGLMPGLEGHEVCAEMRARPETEAIPVILLTAKAAEAGQSQALDSGANAYMVKPFAIDDLDHALRRLSSGDSDA